MRRGYCGRHYTLAHSKGLFTGLLQNKTKGYTKHPLYSTWAGVNSRAKTTNRHDSKAYESKGITVCSEWDGLNPLGFENFVRDMGEKPSPIHTIDRIDNSLGYSKGNCRWAPRHEQQANRDCAGEVSGVSAHRLGGYIAQLSIDGKFILRRHVRTYEEAVTLRKDAEAIYLTPYLSTVVSSTH
jgi:hypothetical protein